AVALRLTADRLIAANAVTYHAGWNLVGAPEGTRFAGADGPLFTLQSRDDGYETLPAGTPAAAGYGYWLYFPVGRTVQLPPGDQFVTVDLPPSRWVSVGNPMGARIAP